MLTQIEIKASFYNQWIDGLKQELLGMGYPVDPQSDLRDIGIQYYKVMKRLISQKPRVIHKAIEFTCPGSELACLEALEKKIVQGENLKPHLSTWIKTADYDDGMLNDWGIYHLHLGIQMQRDGFVERTGPLLYARFTDSNAYFISVMPHRKWSMQEMVKIIHRNWPDSVKRWKLEGVKALSYQPSDKQIAKLRAAHIQAFVEAEPGVVYAPFGGGYMSDGSSGDVIRIYNNYANTLRRYEQHIKQDADEIVKAAIKDGIDIQKELDFELMFDEGENLLFARERTHNFIIVLGPPAA